MIEQQVCDLLQENRLSCFASYVGFPWVDESQEISPGCKWSQDMQVEFFTGKSDNKGSHKKEVSCKL